MLAKPEYSSPPDEVCCWPGRYGGAFAGRGTVAESHREAFAGRGTVAERLQRGSAMAEHLLARAPWRSAIGKMFLARALQRSSIGKQPLPERKEEPLLERGDTAGKESHCQKGKVRSAAAGEKGLQGATGWSLFLMRPLCKLFLYL